MTEPLHCAACGKDLDPVRHGGLVCDGQVYCDECRRYERQLLVPREFQEMEQWCRRLCRDLNCEPPLMVQGEGPPSPGPFDFLEDMKLLMGEVHHRKREITLYPAGWRLVTLCHELAHLLTGQDHTVAWARTFAQLVARVKAQLPEDHYTKGFSTNLLRSDSE